MHDFVHLHVHTQYSLLDGAIRIPQLMKRVKELGMTAVAMTDHGNMYGAVDFQKSAKSAGVKPIIGCEQYVTTQPYETSRDPKSYHLTLLAKNRVGYANLMELNSMSWLHGRHPRTGIPRADFELITKYADGLVCLSGDLGSELNQAILRDDLDGARAIARRYHALFGDDYYIEIMDNALPETKKCREAAIAIARELDIQLVATNDCHYVDPSDAEAQAILMCIQLGKTVELERLMEHGLDQLYVRSGEEMYVLFSDVPDACENTVKIAEKCDLQIPLGEVYLPLYDVPASFIEERGLADKKTSIGEYFAHVSREGLDERFAEFEMLGVEVDRDEYRARLELEIDVIRGMDFPGYFLIVWDFIRWAKENEIPVGPGRGSGAGSLVAYALQITDIDPIPYTLLFERFLNPERVSMPDFDIDFCMNRRGEVIDYVTNKYGKDNVGQIVTYGQLKARACIRDVGRALNFSFGETDAIAKLVPDRLNITLEEALAEEPRLRDLRAKEPRVDKMFEIALRLENLNRQAGMHAAGVVISEEPLWKYVPICRGANDEIVTQYAKNEVEEAGLVKFDFLGLKTLTVIDDAVRLINAQRTADDRFDLRRIPMDDAAVYKEISRGNTTGIFQLESSGFQELLKKLKPDCFEDIIAAVALYRPGPLGSGMVDDFIDRKHGRKKVEYPHPWLEEVLKPTYGVMVYQEQVMKTAQVMAGYSLGGADLLRRAMGKKKPEVMAQQKGIFVEGAVKLDVPEQTAGDIFDLMAYFAGYGFNKSHSAAYALITYQTAWLKVHYPVEFMAALMTSDRDNTDKVVRFISEAKQMGIEVLPPSVNESQLDFSVVDGKIRFGLGAIKGVGAGVIEVILAARADGGPFTSLYEFCQRVDQKQINKRTLEALVKCGAFDSVAPDLAQSRYIGDIALARARMVGAISTAVDQGAKKQHDAEVGQSSLFGMMSAAQLDTVLEEFYPDAAPWTDRELLGYEKEFLGFYVTGHPLDRYDSEVALYGATPAADISAARKNNGDAVAIAGVVSEIRERPLKSGAGRMAFVKLEDKTGEVDVIVFSREFDGIEAVLKCGEPILIKGEVREEGDAEAKSYKVRAQEAKQLADARREVVRRVRLDLHVDEIKNGELRHLRELFARFHGPCRTSLLVNMHSDHGKGRAEIPLPEPFWVEPHDELLMQVERLFRRASVVRLA